MSHEEKQVLGAIWADMQMRGMPGVQKYEIVLVPAAEAFPTMNPPKGDAIKIQYIGGATPQDVLNRVSTPGWFFQSQKFVSEIGRR